MGVWEIVLGVELKLTEYLDISNILCYTDALDELSGCTLSIYWYDI